MAAESHARVMSQSSKSVATSEMLIELVRNYPVLFDKRHVKHKDNMLKDELWNKIGSELGLSGIAAQNKFKNLKDTFNKQRNKIKDSMRSGAGAADVPTVKWAHFESMMSLMGPVLKEPIICTNIDFASPERTPNVDRPSTSTEGSTEVAETPQLEDAIYDASSQDELSGAGASPLPVTPAIMETDSLPSAGILLLDMAAASVRSHV
ncbi:uncharacterized protein LOC119462562 [Dermacentor silvarum]|uniref:uncharacterized protein LOC119462562 n=1 Tax=Dermacentor silvarum TaxID=543639 RepID=UPI00189B68B8|nr:uncharacterized protein LOC119462562 [Dermacentor silvarum]